MSNGADNGNGGSGVGQAANAWDFAKDFGRAVLAIAALIYLTVFLVRHYKDVKDVTTVLGVVIPVLGAALGATIGYAGGRSAGQAGKDAAVRQGRKRLARQLKEPIEEARQQVSGGLVEPIKEALPSPAGTDFFAAGPEQPLSQPLRFEASTLDGAQQRLEALSSIVETVAEE